MRNLGGFLYSSVLIDHVLYSKSSILVPTSGFCYHRFPYLYRYRYYSSLSILLAHGSGQFQHRSTLAALPQQNKKKKTRHQSDSSSHPRAEQNTTKKKSISPRLGARRQGGIVTFTVSWPSWQQSILVQFWPGHIRQAEPTETWPSVGTLVQPLQPGPPHSGVHWYLHHSTQLLIETNASIDNHKIILSSNIVALLNTILLYQTSC